MGKKYLKFKETNVKMAPPLEYVYNSITVGNLTLLQQAPTTGGLHETDEG